MEFAFEGFQSALPWWILLVLAVASILLSWWSYEKYSGLSRFYRYGLVFLRSAVFLILFLLLLNPFFRSDRTYRVKPRITVLMDNSASMTIEKGTYNGEESFRRVLRDLALDDSSRVRFEFYRFDENVIPDRPGSLSFDGSETNLYNAVNVIKNSERKVRAGILITDGIFNKGRDPSFLSTEIETPIYTVAVGDTSRLQDLVIRNLQTNATGYLNTLHPVRATIYNNGFTGQPVRVELRSGEEILQTKTIRPPSDLSTTEVQFELQLETEGLRQFEMVIPGRSGEWTEANNRQPFSIEVLDSKQQILSLAWEIHPDVGAIRSLLRSDENTRLYTRTWVRGSRFVESGGLGLDPDTLDLIILHGYPRAGLSDEMEIELAGYLDRVPYIFVATPSSAAGSLARQGVELPLSPAGFSRPVSRVQPQPALDHTAHPVLELPEIEEGLLPAVYAPLDGLEAVLPATVLFNSVFQGQDTGLPLIAVSETGNMRASQLQAFGWYRYFQDPSPVIRNWVNALFFNLVSWTASKPDSRRLKVYPSQKVYSGSESVSFDAFLTNESGESESDAVIDLTLDGSSIDTRLYTMNNQGNGQYTLQIGSLPEGIYTYAASARKGQRTIDTGEGEFSISSSNIEFVNTLRNDPLLERIAASTGGAFFTFQDAPEVRDHMEQQNLFEQSTETETTFFYFHRHAAWFIIIILLLTGEWLLRKYAALP
ncbi:MAG: hypothetical protein R3211_04775 [Balneolaceae bacterium]|nr:hypothetical protein [Balneolaceae bacterium]